MLSKTLQESLNNQVKHEAASSQAYLAMASWCDIQPGLQGVTEFFYQQSEEEREHMLKLVKYINERGGMAIVPALEQPVITYPSLKKLFENFMQNETGVSESINDIVHLALQEKDYATHNFLQWYVAEQIEEERLARTLNEKLEMIGEDKSGLYLFDRDIVSYRTSLSKYNSKRGH
ncbi:MAG: ferritin [Bacteroidota bacterium]